MFQRRATEEIRARGLDPGAGGARPRCSSPWARPPSRATARTSTSCSTGRGSRVEAQRGSLVRRLQLADLGRAAFWELCDLLLAGAPAIPETSPSARLPPTRSAFDGAAARGGAARSARDPRARGVVYLGRPAAWPAPVLADAARPATRRPAPATPSVQRLPARPRAGGPPGGATRWSPRSSSTATQRLAGHQFLLFLSEHSAYARLTGPDGRAFHTSDEPLVDAPGRHAPGRLRPAAALAEDRAAMAPVRKILVADADPETVRLLAPPLRQRGYHVHAARDGSRALQVAILRFPDLILLRRADPARSTPRPSSASCAPTRAPSGSRWCSLGDWRRTPTGPAPAPTCRSRSRSTRCWPGCEQLFRRADAARAAGESRDLEGDLSHIPLPDLLQVLAVNHRTGRLTLERGERAGRGLAPRGAGGRRRARAGGGREGALAAPDAAARGTSPSAAAAARASSGSTGGSTSCCWRGCASTTSWRRCARPCRRRRPAGAGGRSGGAAARPPPGHPRGGGGARRRRSRVAELLDRCAASDLEVCPRPGSPCWSTAWCAARRPAAGPARAVGPSWRPTAPRAAHPGGPRPLLRAAHHRQGGGGRRRAALAAAALPRLAALPGFTPRRAGPEAERFGTLGRLALGDGLRVDLVELPVRRRRAAALAPLRRRGGGRAGAPAGRRGDAAPRRSCRASCRLPLVATGPARGEVPAPLRDAPGGVAYERERRRPRRCGRS